MNPFRTKPSKTSGASALRLPFLPSSAVTHDAMPTVIAMQRAKQMVGDDNWLRAAMQRYVLAKGLNLNPTDPTGIEAVKQAIEDFARALVQGKREAVAALGPRPQAAAWFCRN